MIEKFYNIFFTAAVVVSVPFLEGEDVDKQISKNNTITVIEFWADWNKLNEVKELENLKKCEKYRVDIGKNPVVQLEHNVKVVPTIIIFEKGKEVERFEANVMFQMCHKSFSIKKVQKSVDKILYSKFE